MIKITLLYKSYFAIKHPVSTLLQNFVTCPMKLMPYVSGMTFITHIKSIFR